MKKIFKAVSNFLRKQVEAVENAFNLGVAMGYGRAMQTPQRGSASLKGIIGIVILVVVLAAAIPVLWPMIADSDADIQAMNGTDDGTGFIQKFWPIMILVGGIGIGVGILMKVIKKYKLG